MRRLAPTLGFLGLGLLTVWGLWAYALPSIGLAARRTLLGAAALSILLSLWIGRAAVREALSTRRLKIGFHAVVYTVVVSVLLLLVNFAAARNRYRWDLTEGQQWSLSDVSRRILSRVDEEVLILGFFTNDQKREERQARYCYRMYDEVTPRITYRIEDPLRNPALQQKYGTIRPGMTLVESGGRVRRAMGFDQTTVTNLVAAVAGGRRSAAFLTGKGMRSPEARDVDGYFQFNALLQEAFFEVSSVTPRPGDRLDPSQANLMVLAGPREPLEPFEVTFLQEYLAAGGHILAFADPPARDGVSPLADLLAPWGLRYEPGIVAQRTTSASPWHVYASRFSQSDALGTLPSEMEGERVLFDLPGRLAAVEADDVRTFRGAIVGVLPGEDGVFVVPEVSGSRPDPEGPTIDVPANEGLILAGFAYRPVLQDGRAIATSRLVVIADADFGDNATLSGSNHAFLSKVVTWLTGENLVVQEEAGGSRKAIAWLDKLRTITLVAVAPPLVVAIVGVTVLTIRRRR